MACNHNNNGSNCRSQGYKPQKIGDDPLGHGHFSWAWACFLESRVN